MMSLKQVNWTLLLVYYCLQESRLKINSISILIAEWDGINTFSTLWLLLHDFIDYIIAYVLDPSIGIPLSDAFWFIYFLQQTIVLSFHYSLRCSQSENSCIMWLLLSDKDIRDMQVNIR